VPREVLKALRNPAKALFVGLIRFYQVVISPSLSGRCKYYPSCSQYALEAVREYGAARGFVLAVWRVCRCNPLSYGGYDPVSRQRLFGTKPHSEAPLGGPELAEGCELAECHDPARCRTTGLVTHHRRSADHHLVRG
jgi:uncharacterized protein